MPMLNRRNHGTLNFGFVDKGDVMGSMGCNTEEEIRNKIPALNN